MKYGEPRERLPIDPIYVGYIGILIVMFAWAASFVL